MTVTLLLLLKLSVGAVILAIGMDSTVSDLTYLWRRPLLLLRSLLAMYLLVPLAALAAAVLLTLPTGVEVALLVLAVSAGAPLLPRKLLHIGDGAYIFSLVVTSTLLAIVAVPTWLAILGPYFGEPAELRPREVALVFAKSFFLPLAIGMLIRWRFPAFALKVGDALLRIGGAVLVLCALLLLAMNWELLLEARWSSLLALAGVIFTALVIGHMLGGPSADDRTALAIACATRHIGIAALVAATVPGPRTAVLIAAYVLVSAVVSIPYLQWRRRGQRSSQQA